MGTAVSFRVLSETYFYETGSAQLCLNSGFFEYLAWDLDLTGDLASRFRCGLFSLRLAALSPPSGRVKPPLDFSSTVRAGSSKRLAIWQKCLNLLRSAR